MVARSAVARGSPLGPPTCQTKTMPVEISSGFEALTTPDLSEIRVLPEAVVNQIAAGEVVERPASIVKELIENSIDAQASRIAIEVLGGGRQLIRVTDNGVGMRSEDSKLCFSRHATSKLQSAEDLFSIKTLGFRGEALGSIASVSRVCLETQTGESETGVSLNLAAGEVLERKDGAFPQGTQVTVEDVFYNVPARRKFLKTESSELSQITSHATNYALAFPHIHFTLKSGKFELLSAPPATDIRERILQVFGRDLLAELIEHRKDFGSSGVKIQIFTSRPHVQKFNRNSMFFFVNGRAIRDRIILHAYRDAYRTILPSGTFPVTMLYLETKTADLDVNVHPAKTEVRFRNGSLIHDSIRDTIREALKLDKTIVPMSGDTRQSSPYTAPDFQSRLPASWEDGQIATEPLKNAPDRFEFSNLRELDLKFDREEVETGLSAVGSTPVNFDLVKKEMRPLGQLRDSFIVAVDSSGLVLIDQHVAHERVLFESYMKERSSGQLEVQQLLMPLVLELNPQQESILESISPELVRNGFAVEPFGPRSIAVKTAPAMLKAGDVEKLLRELLDGFEEESKNLSIDSFKERIAATVACHASIKINNSLDDVKMRWLVEELMRTDCPTVCPHGRPIIVRYDLREIKKAFKRL